MSQDSYVYCQYADDIRREVNGKLTLVGVYQGAMFIYGGMPHTLPRLTILAHLMMREKREVKALQFRVLWDEAVIQTLDIPHDYLQTLNADPPPSKFGPPMGKTIQAQVFLQPFEIPAEGILRVVADLDGDLIRGNALRIQEAPPDAPPLM